MRNAAREWRRADAERLRLVQKRADMKRRGFAATVTDVEAMWDVQGGLCAMCGEPGTEKNPLVLDHDHKTGKLRGFIHKKENSGLGFFADDPDALVRASEYLRKAA